MSVTDEKNTLVPVEHTTPVEPAEHPGAPVASAVTTAEGVDEQDVPAEPVGLPTELADLPKTPKPAHEGDDDWTIQDGPFKPGSEPVATN
ncbi:hypothetical protein [Actinosynnema sp. NPDC020468]|uniref:hypothetical protein n=1 Tax=Actinosynnema sp. NPDC020468 TaxID=3154488 RepID=UPI0033C51300